MTDARQQLNPATPKTAIWVVTPNGARLARTLSAKLGDAQIFLSRGVTARVAGGRSFNRLKEVLPAEFARFDAHIFIMSTGIVVRMIAPLIRHKTKDPAVVVVDDRGMHVISLLSGHIGGANRLTRRVARWIAADPVITTATDINAVPAIDVLAQSKGLVIENPEAIKFVNMAFLTGRSVGLYDPYRLVKAELESSTVAITPIAGDVVAVPDSGREPFEDPTLFVADTPADVAACLPGKTLILRPRVLVAGMGCNRNTPLVELRALLLDVLNQFQLAPGSLKSLASINLKSDEQGLLALAAELDIPLNFYSREQLNTVTAVPNPSAMVEKHVGVKSVCEAAAILGADQGNLIAPKHTTRNVTVAIARIAFL